MMPPSSARNGNVEQRLSTDASSERASERGSWTIRDFFTIPRFIKPLFDKVPLTIYAPNEPPLRARIPASIPTLFVFSNEGDAAAGRPSFNPSCLKWQTFLNIAGIDYQLLPSNNHSSPTGALPFLLPPTTSTPSRDTRPIGSNKLLKYAREHGTVAEESGSMRYEAYQSLLDNRIRNAWLYTLYLETVNFSHVAYPLYVASASSNTFVRASISHQLHKAAEAALAKHSSIIDTDDLYSEADKAFEALSLLLGEDEWFFGNEKPALFDASVFAYTQLLLDDRLGWKEQKLCRALRSRENLVQHRDRLLVKYFP